MAKDAGKEPEDKKNYELSCLLRDENSAKDVSRLLSQHGVRVVFESPLRKINLAYEIDHLLNAHFGFFSLLSSPSDIKNLERDLNSVQSVMRFLIISLPEKSVSGCEKDSASEPRRPRTMRPSRISEPRQPKPLSNEALEKKIEEILQ